MAKYADLFKSPSEGSSLTEEIVDAPGSKPQENFTIIFVDDEENVVKALKRVFLEENYQIITVSSGQEALKHFEGKPIHLIISDYKMPGMDGVELLKAIRSRWPDTIRIMLTAYADVQAVMGAVNDGAVYKFITKPWNDEDLRLTVSLALQQYELIQENRKLKDYTVKQQVKIKNMSAMYEKERKVLGNLLVKLAVVTQEELEKAQKMKSEFLTDALVKIGATTEAKIIKALQGHLKIDYIDLKEININQGIVKFLPKEFCERNRVIPVNIEGDHMSVAMADPSDIFLKDNMEFMTGLRVIPFISSSTEIVRQIQKVYDETCSDRLEDIDMLTGIEPMDEIDIVIEDEEELMSVQELLTSSGIPPIIRVVNAIISEAIRLKASDIHIEPKSKYTIIRYRIDGILHTKIKLPIDIHAATVSRIKIISRLDISERRKPQDGRITVKSGTRLVDIRVSTLPTINGEKITLRILDKNAAVKTLDELGVGEEDLKRINELSKKPHGIIISTGPTGSGKTTTLYSLLNAMLTSTRNFETIEDPVEYFLEEASQVYVKDKIGLSFASVLRSTLRQDPDVILVGEIRDYETADVVFKAGLTGHTVLTSLHTNHSVASISRLIDLGIPPYLIASAIEGIIAQRLARKVCPYCKKEFPINKEAVELLNCDEAIGSIEYKGIGCRHCNNTGYWGRIGIFEIFVMNDEFRHIISSNYRESELMNAARLSGMHTLLEDGANKVKKGLTTTEELLRVLGPQHRSEFKCGGCSRMINTKFLFCPYCGTFRSNICMSCRNTIEEEWSICPYCGASKQSV